MADYSYIGVGKVYLREYGASAPALHIGNVSSLKTSVEEEVKELKDFTSVGGGTYNEVRRISSVQLEATLHDLSAANLAKALFGISTAISATPIVDESHVVYAGGFMATRYPCTGAIVVKEGATTLTADVDYTVVPGGIEVISGGALADGNTALLSYTPDAGFEVQALLTSAKEYEITFAGLNDARSGKPVIFTAFRWKIGPTQGLDLIGEDFAALPVQGKLLKDTTKNGTTASQYFRVQVVS